MKDKEMRIMTLNHHPPRPILFAALALMAGHAAGFLLPVWPVLPGVAGVACLVWTAWSFWRSRRIHGPQPGRGLALLLALGLLGWCQAGWIAANDQAALEAVVPWTAERLVCVEGTLSAEPRVAPDHIELILAAPRIAPLRVGTPAGRLGLAVAVSITEQAAITLNTQPRALPLPGQQVRAWGRLRQILPPTSPAPFDPERAALSKGIGARLTVAKPGDLELGPLPGGPRASFYAALRQVRGWIVTVLQERLPPDQMPMARALLLGDAFLVPPPERDAYSLTGMAHLLAVSGLNTAFVLMLLVGLTRLAGLSPRGAARAGIAGVLAYAALTGFEPPVARAAVMGCFILWGYLLKRVTTPLASLAAAAFVTLLADPRNLTRVDWQLSYACILSIIILHPPLYDVMSRLLKHEAAPGEPPQPAGWPRRAVQNYFLLPLAGVIAVHLGILPLHIYYFRQYNILSPLYNIICCGLSLYVMLGVMIAALLGWLAGVGALAGWLAQGGLDLLAWLVHHMAAVPHVTFNMVPLAAPLVLLYYATLLGGSWLASDPAASDEHLTPPQRLSLAYSLGLILALVVWSQVATAPGAAGDTMDLYCLDVGQGDGIVMRSPGGKILVVDAGPAQGSSDRGRQTVAPFLKTMGINTIDCLATSHADSDHIGGIPYLLEHFGVDLMLEGPDPTAPSELFRAMRRLEETRQVNRWRAMPGATLAGFDPVRIRFLGPVPGTADNNASLVLLLDYHEVQILLTGDLESAGETRLIAEGLASDVEILKLGHHGSRTATSEAFLEAVRPELALISAGRNNRYNHPSPDTLRRLEAHGIMACRTDNLGTLWIRTDGHRIRIYHYAGP